MKILSLITARGRSKSVPGKNLRKIGGLSLIGFKVIAARRSKYCSRLIVSTDSLEIQEEARRHGAEVPFIRPPELATDTASSADVIQHTMTWVEREMDENFDAIMLLEPSSPFARWIDLDRAVELMSEKDASLVVGVRETEVNSVFVGPLDGQGRITRIIDQLRETKKHPRRQDMRPEYTMNGALYLFKLDLFKKHKTFYADREKSFGYVMDRYHSIEIDEMFNLQWAEFVFSNGYIDRSYWQ